MRLASRRCERPSGSAALFEGQVPGVDGCLQQLVDARSDGGCDGLCRGAAAQPHGVERQEHRIGLVGHGWPTYAAVQSTR